MMVRLFQGQKVRLAIAAGLVAIVAIAVLPYFLNYVSYSAYVNAELYRISAPIPGTIVQPLPPDGAFIREDRSLRLVEAVAPDRNRLAELEQEQAAARTRLTLARAHLAQINARAASLSERADGFTVFAQSLTTQEAALYEAELRTCRVEEQLLRQDRDRARELANRGSAPILSVTIAEADLDAQTARCAAAEARLERARIKASAADQEIFLEDGFNDAPYSVQELDRLFLRRLELEAEVSEIEMAEQRLAYLISSERERLDRATQFEAVLPARHVVWTVGASEGTAVVEGQTLIELADCASRFVSVLLSERAVSSIDVGDAASVRLVGSRRWITGQVTAVSGSAARRDVQLLAAESPEPSARRFLVDVALPAASLGENVGDRCGVGRLAEVRFNRFGLGGDVDIADAEPAPDQPA
ncbi:MAG: HlyD family efflux transporter periplasmic adaptor subunit [Maricaulaceae bacterium]|jgi:multidrug resistance efflux pump